MQILRLEAPLVTHSKALKSILSIYAFLQS
jgi:hypothetical protein